jgi:capsule polysaccharide export protein KpsE/RkpR
MLPLPQSSSVEHRMPDRVVDVVEVVADVVWIKVVVVDVVFLGVVEVDVVVESNCVVVVSKIGSSKTLTSSLTNIASCRTPEDVMIIKKNNVKPANTVAPTSRNHLKSSITREMIGFDGFYKD